MQRTISIILLLKFLCSPLIADETSTNLAVLGLELGEEVSLPENYDNIAGKGILVSGVVFLSEAYFAGIESGDIITFVHIYSGREEIVQYIESRVAGEEFQISFVRGDKKPVDFWKILEIPGARKNFYGTY